MKIVRQGDGQQGEYQNCLLYTSELETEKKLGTHRGYWFHTIGQRKGLGLSGGPWFVVKKDMEENTIYAVSIHIQMCIRDSHPAL